MLYSLNAMEVCWKLFGWIHKFDLGGSFYCLCFGVSSQLRFMLVLCYWLFDQVLSGLYSVALFAPYLTGMCGQMNETYRPNERRKEVWTPCTYYPVRLKLASQYTRADDRSWINRCLHTHHSIMDIPYCANRKNLLYELWNKEYSYFVSIKIFFFVRLQSIL